MVVAWAEGDQEPLLAAAGYSDTERLTPLHVETPFFIGSISKNVFATIALQLTEEGLLALDDPLSRYVEWPRPDEIMDCSFADEALRDSADGSIVSSAADLLRYHQALRGGELLSAASWEAMRHVAPGLDNGLGYLIMTGPLGDHQGNVGRAMGHARTCAPIHSLESRVECRYALWCLATLTQTRRLGLRTP